MGDDQLQRRWLYQALSQRDVGLNLADVAVYLCCSQGSHRGPHQGTVNAVETQQGCCLVVSTATPDFVEKPIGQAGLVVRQQIHVGEGDFACHIDPAQVFIEFNAVEQAYALADQYQIGQMQIAVALAHPAAASACQQPWQELLLLRQGPGAQSVQSPGQVGLWQRAQQRIKIVQRRCQN